MANIYIELIKNDIRLCNTYVKCLVKAVKE